MIKVGRGQTDKWNDTKRERKLGQGLVSWGRDTEEQKRGRRDREIVAHGKWDEFQPNTGWLRHACCRTDQSTTQFREVIFCLSLSLRFVRASPLLSRSRFVFPLYSALLCPFPWIENVRECIYWIGGIVMPVSDSDR